MPVPPLRKWRWPRFMWYRRKHIGWQLFVDVAPDYNPILIISRWGNSGLYIRAFERDIITPKRS